MVTVVFSAAMAFVGNQERGRMETAVTRHFATASRLSTIQTDQLDAETGLRGHLLTGRLDFLEPYERAPASPPDELGGLWKYVRGELGEEGREEKLASLDWIYATVVKELSLPVGMTVFHSNGSSLERPIGSLEGGLAAIEPARRAELPVLRLRMAIFHALGIWEPMVGLCSCLAAVGWAIMGRVAG